MLAMSDEERRLSEDWVETAELAPSEAGPVDLIGLVIVARLRILIDPTIVAFEGSTDDGLVVFEDRREDGVVPITVRALAATVAAELTSNDYRFDLIAMRDGLTTFWASGVRRFRS